MRFLGAAAYCGAILVACASSDSARVKLPTCPAHDSSARPSVAGTFRYSSLRFGLSGTIVFEQQGESVRVVDTSYDQHDDRPLEGESALEGNQLDILLVPKNGDTDYSAQVRILFDESGDSFCLASFSDTNGDQGGEGTYTGSR